MESCLLMVNPTRGPRGINLFAIKPANEANYPEVIESAKPPPG